MSTSSPLILLTHGQAERDGIRLLSEEGRAAVRHAGVYLARFLDDKKWPAITLAGSAPAFRCVETLLLCAGELPVGACTSSNVRVFPQLAEIPATGISSDRLLSAAEQTEGATLMSVHGDLVSAFPSSITERLNSSEFELSEGGSFFIPRPVLCVLSLTHRANLESAVIETCIAMGHDGHARSLLRVTSG
jgi:phosphohistidine phosphatase SixA